MAADDHGRTPRPSAAYVGEHAVPDSRSGPYARADRARRPEAGQKLPAERDLADEWGIADQTVRRAMRELRERGLVVSPVGKGTFVTSRSRLVADQKGPGRHSDQASLKIA